MDAACWLANPTSCARTAWPTLPHSKRSPLPAAEGATAIFVAADGRAAGVLTVADPVKATTSQALAELRELGVNVLMLYRRQSAHRQKPSPANSESPTSKQASPARQARK